MKPFLILLFTAIFGTGWSYAAPLPKIKTLSFSPVTENKLLPACTCTSYFVRNGIRYKIILAFTTESGTCRYCLSTVTDAAASLYIPGYNNDNAIYSGIPTLDDIADVCGPCSIAR